MPKPLACTLRSIKEAAPPAEPKDIYWLAGMLEGEGSFCQQPNRKFPRISFVSTDFDVALRVATLLNCNVGGRGDKNRPGHHKPVYLVQVAGREAIGWMMTLYRLMGQRRRAKIRELLQDWKR